MNKRVVRALVGGAMLRHRRRERRERSNQPASPVLRPKPRARPRSTRPSQARPDARAVRQAAASVRAAAQGDLEGAVRRHLDGDLRLRHRLFLSRHLADPAPGRRPARVRLRDRAGQREGAAQRLCRRLGQQRLLPQHRPDLRRDRPRSPASGSSRWRDKLTVDLGYIRYNYPGATSDLFFDFNEFGLVVGYDFGVAQVSGAVRYSPNFFANSGIAWYKWAPGSPCR